MADSGTVGRGCSMEDAGNGGEVTGMRTVVVDGYDGCNATDWFRMTGTRMLGCVLRQNDRIETTMKKTDRADTTWPSDTSKQ